MFSRGREEAETGMVREQGKRRLRCMVAAGLMLIVSGCATAPAVVSPDWTSIPTPESLGEAFPGFAADAGVAGRARLKCELAISGMLENCRVASESPYGLGFGAAAMALGSEFRAEPASRNGVPVRSQVAFPIRFSLPPVEPVLPWTGPPADPEALSVARQVVARLRLSLTTGPDAVRLDGLAADRVESVREMVAAVERETGAALREAYALELARTQSLSNLRLLTRGQRRPGRPNMSDDEIARAQDQVIAVGQAQNDRIRSLYCARYDCDLD